MNSKISMLIENMEKVIIGKQSVILKLLTAMLAGGHVLIEDVPGVGKTQLVAALARSLSGVFNRIQFTPDIMPSDIVGYNMIDLNSKQMEYRQGVTACNFLLGDEINRASPKVQSALLEVMEELQTTVDGVTRVLPAPFMVLATQNPIETYGTYHLPEAQMDRFLMKLSIGYPTQEDELHILENNMGKLVKNTIDSVLNLQDILELKAQVENIKVNETLKKYIVDLVNATRKSELITLGVSPRGSIALYNACRAYALIHNRDYSTPDDVKSLAGDVCAHRLILSAKGRASHKNSREVMKEILGSVEIQEPDRFEV